MKFKDIHVGCVTYSTRDPEETKRKLLIKTPSMLTWRILSTGIIREEIYDPENEWSVEHWPLDESTQIKHILNNYT